MDEALARRMIALTQDFYQRTAASFSATRQAPWDGWQHVWELTDRTLGPFNEASPLKMLDIGAGNLRFERFLERQVGSGLRAWAVDSCSALLADGLSERATPKPDEPPLVGTLGGPGTVALRPLDVMAALADGTPADVLARSFDAPLCSLAVAFGFFHHVPAHVHRATLLQALVESVETGGLVAVSLWQFADDQRLRAKAESATARGTAAHGLPPLPENDYLLGWQDDLRAFRYCHHFAEHEVDALAASLSPIALEVTRFSADGRTGALNRYLVLRRIAN